MFHREEFWLIRFAGFHIVSSQALKYVYDSFDQHFFKLQNIFYKIYLYIFIKYSVGSQIEYKFATIDFMST